MERATYFNVYHYKEYRKFIANCSKVEYDNSLVLHKHHIIPKHLWGNANLSVNNKTNLIKISVDDHVKAHLLLAECYEKGTYEYISNLRSAKILSMDSIKDMTILDELKNTYLGKNNPFYGKTHTNKTKDKLREYGKLRKGIDYTELYGDRSDKEKSNRKNSVKKYWDNMSDKDREERCKKISEASKNRAKVSTNKISIEGVIYNSVKEASELLDITRYYLNKNYNIIKINN